MLNTTQAVTTTQAAPIIKGQQSSSVRLPITKSHLLDILSLVRPANSKGEQAMVKYITDHLNALDITHSMDGYGNIIVNLLPTHETPSRVMFTAHTDTVHRNTGATQHTQSLAYLDAKHEIVGLSADSPSSCLGADDGTGCWVLLSLIQAKIPALYVFFRAEEIGGLGSEFFRNDKANADLLPTLTHCISFDRKGYTDIVTEQWGGVCASDGFAEHLATLFKQVDNELNFSKATGTFTDSANFTDIITECTNISVGYDKQHTAGETQDVAFAERLVKALKRIDWLSLPHYRDPNAKDVLCRATATYDDTWWYTDGYYDTDIDTHIHYLERLGAEYAEDLVFNDPYTAIELLTYLTKGY